MKKTLYSLIAAAIFVLAFVAIYKIPAEANPSILGIAGYLATTTSNNTVIASSTATYITTSSASSTQYMIFPMGDADQVDLNMAAVASSTSSNLLFAFDFSDESGCYSNQASCNWYREDANSISGSIVTHSALTYHTWTLGQAPATTTKNVTVSSVGAKFIRVSFTVIGANITLWAQSVPKIQAR